MPEIPYTVRLAPELLERIEKTARERGISPRKLIRAALADICSSGVVELRFRGLGFFPNERRPRVLWAGIEASPSLRPVQYRTRNNARSLASRKGGPCNSSIVFNRNLIWRGARMQALKLDRILGVMQSGTNPSGSNLRR